MLNKIIRKIFGSRKKSGAFNNVQESLDYFDSLKNLHLGKRGFLIGNGPSLRYDDLEKLKNEITIASNKIYLAFDNTQWRPNYYTVADPLVWEKIHNEIPELLKIVHLPSYIQQLSCKCDVYQWKCFEKYSGDGNKKSDPPDFSNNISEGLFGSCTITFDNLQFAAHLGLSPIYLIGCDHFYSGEQNVTRDKPVEVKDQINHFHKKYRTKGELVNPAPIDVMERGYSEARKFSDQKKIPILNATRGGHLDIFHRVDFESLFE